MRKESLLKRIESSLSNYLHQINNLYIRVEGIGKIWQPRWKCTPSHWNDKMSCFSTEETWIIIFFISLMITNGKNWSQKFDESSDDIGQRSCIMKAPKFRGQLAQDSDPFTSSSFEGTQTQRKKTIAKGDTKDFSYCCQWPPTQGSRNTA